MDRPYHLSWSQIAELTDRQVIDIYYRPRDREGVPLPFESTDAEKIKLEPVSNLEERKFAFLQMAASIGMKQADAENKWVEALPRIRAEMGQVSS